MQILTVSCIVKYYYCYLHCNLYFNHFDELICYHQFEMMAPVSIVFVGDNKCVYLTLCT